MLEKKILFQKNKNYKKRNSINSYVKEFKIKIKKRQNNLTLFFGINIFFAFSLANYANITLQNLHSFRIDGFFSQLYSID